MAGAEVQGLPTPTAAQPPSPAGSSAGSPTPSPTPTPLPAALSSIPPALSPTLAATQSTTPAARPSPPALKAPKAASASDCHRLEDLPNIGPAMAADLRALGIAHPRELAQRDAFVLYQSLCALSGKRQDPCVLDTFMAATDFMRGAAPAPWWAYTAQRKLLYGAV